MRRVAPDLRVYPRAAHHDREGERPREPRNRWNSEEIRTRQDARPPNQAVEHGPPRAPGVVVTAAWAEPAEGHPQTHPGWKNDPFAPRAPQPG